MVKDLTQNFSIGFRRRPVDCDLETHEITSNKASKIEQRPINA